MSREEGKIRRKPVSIINWMLTIILSVIPGVNLIGFIVMMIFAKTSPRRLSPQQRSSFACSLPSSSSQLS